MKRIGTFLSILVMVIGLSVSAHAALQDMGDGTIYDTATQLSWLKNANTAGLMNWSQAVAWAASLNNSGGFAGLTGWRLPATTEPDATCGSQFNPGGGFPLQGYGYFCTGSEMGNLYYVSLGNVAGGPLTNTVPFTNVQAYYYWSGTAYAPNPTNFAWSFYFFNGTETTDGQSSNVYAWAVRPGSRTGGGGGGGGGQSHVPASGTVGLIGLGLAGLIIVGMRLRKATS